MRVDNYKLMHWLNTRKMTTGQVAEAVGLDHGQFEKLLSVTDEWPDELADALARALQITPEQLVASGRADLTVLLRTAQELRDTRRPIQRDGIHFYNYYTMAAPQGAVAPVILDIRCPADRLPALNNGHLEPAITINLGPGDIHGRWGEELGEATWQVISANPDEDNWIVGDSYVEPSYCPHTYSLASDASARIVSYTGQSALAGLIEDVNDWSDPAAHAMLGWLDESLTPQKVATLLLSRRGHTIESAAEALGIRASDLIAALDEGALDQLRDLGTTLGFDYRLLLRPATRHDAVGKTFKDIAQCRKEIRDFQGYRVTSLASAPHLPDLTGLFLLVAGQDGANLCEPAESHYLVTAGSPTLHWTDAAGQERHSELEVDASAWVAPFVTHRWSGDGALIKLGSGRHLGYLDLYELTNTYAAVSTVRRGRRDSRGWGYDS
ncbi:helix-turn-helix transcriptional regulator [Nocardia colli]|uniref:Helix-turn-helix transcriptional regulator n=1 Tax=Nocardia colli TaxID=2545717 RepID=A0A5N0EBC9_9NOCA|nr:helix-turn-helix domain-containing protein [Nocardia colli]KAA8884801.1 helix-turn-helix transcriptional regulator [Nocardia colli]